MSFQGEHDPGRPYAARPRLVRSAIIAAEPLANPLVAITVFAVILATSGEATVLAVSTSIVPGQAAEHAGFQPGDRILIMDGKPIATFEDMRPVLRASAGKIIRFEVQRSAGIVDLFARFAGLGTTLQDGRQIGLLGIFSTTLSYRVLPPTVAVVRAAEKTWITMAETEHAEPDNDPASQGTVAHRGQNGSAVARYSRQLALRRIRI